MNSTYSSGPDIGTLLLWAAITLVISGFVIYAAVRLALRHDRELQRREAAETAEPQQTPTA